MCVRQKAINIIYEPLRLMFRLMSCHVTSHLCHYNFKNALQAHFSRAFPFCSDENKKKMDWNGMTYSAHLIHCGRRILFEPKNSPGAPTDPSPMNDSTFRNCNDRIRTLTASKSVSSCSKSKSFTRSRTSFGNVVDAVQMCVYCVCFLIRH